ncbi:MAG TPA: hypothetical protein VE617_07860, partial [Propionibacteriaceae bacterium]|nr:hypothetical protein [Propionibacteriaceae bacterium]
GKLLASGPPADVLTPDLLRDVFGLEAEVIPDPTSGTPLVLPLRRASGRSSFMEKTPPMASYGRVPAGSEGENSPVVEFSPQEESDR